MFACAILLSVMVVIGVFAPPPSLAKSTMPSEPIPGIFEFFGVPLGQSQTTYGEVAGDVGTLLNGPVGNFGAFQLPTLHSPADLKAYQSILPSSIIVNGLIQFLPHPLFVTTNVSLALTTPANLPNACPINWCAQVFGTNGIATNGITVQVNTNDSTQVTVSVDTACKDKLCFTPAIRQQTEFWFLPARLWSFLIRRGQP